MLKRGIFNYFCRYNSSGKLDPNVSKNISFETVFSFPQIKYIAVINRLKVYQYYVSAITIPGCGLLELLNVAPNSATLTAACIGLSGSAVLTLASIPFRNVIGFLYISEDNKLVKISAVDFWGNRKDRIIDASDWIPLSDNTPNFMDAIYLKPKLVDGTKYKLLVRYGKLTNKQKMAYVLE